MELARRIGQSSQNFNKKLKRGTISLDEMMEIAKALNVRFEQAFVLGTVEKISMRRKLVYDAICVLNDLKG